MYSSIPAFRAVLRPPSAPVLYRYDAGGSQSGWTFTNASANNVPSQVGSGGLVSFVNANTARDANYIGGVRSLLMEASKADKAIKSRGTDFGDAAWIAINTASKTAANATGIDGVANTGATLTVPAANDYVYQALTGLANTQVTLSVWLKGSGTIHLVLFDNISSFQTSLVTLTATLTRYTFTATFGAGATDMRAGLGRIAAPPTATSVIWDGFQVETAAFASSFIPTTTVAVTRAVDALSIVGITTGTATLFYRYWDLATSAWVDVAAVYTSGTAIVPPVDRAYSTIAILAGTYTAAAAASVLGVA